MTELVQTTKSKPLYLRNDIIQQGLENVLIALKNVMSYDLNFK